MHWILVLCAAGLYVTLVPATTTAITVVAIAILTYVTERTASALTGATFSATEALRSVGLAFLFLGLYFLAVNLSGGTEGHWGALIRAAREFGGPGILMLLSGFLVAYTVGFKVGLGINILVASAVALVTSVCSIILLILARPYL